MLFFIDQAKSKPALDKSSVTVVNPKQKRHQQKHEEQTENDTIHPHHRLPETISFISTALSAVQTVLEDKNTISDDIHLY